MISFVMTARNDDYGGDFRLRLQRCVNVLLPLIEKYRLDAEVVIVEWNPPHEKDLLMDAVLWPPGVSNVPVRIIMVPGMIHNMIPSSDRMGMFEFIAKNVGVRRAKGDYVIVTNPDILFSEELIETLARMPLAEDCFYRVDRYDFDGQVPPHGPAELLLKLAKQHIHTVHIRQTDVYGTNFHTMTDKDRQSGIETGNWPGSHTDLSPPDSYGQVLLNDRLGPYGGLHTNGSGDFLMACRNNWFAIRGFPEFVDTFTHLDSYACHQMDALGLKQVLLAAPCMLLHQDHHRKANANRPRHNQSEWMGDLADLRSGRINPRINDEHWGLGGTELAEFSFCQDDSTWKRQGSGGGAVVSKPVKNCSPQENCVDFEVFKHNTREKWHEIPSTRQGREYSSNLLQLPDDELLAYWEQCRIETTTPEVRSWFQDLYKDSLRGLKIADVGPGVGVDGIFFAQHGAQVTFVDIVQDNLNLIERVCKLKGINAEFYFVDDFFSFHFAHNFDLFMFIGSMHHAPMEFAKRELKAMLKFLTPSGKILMLAYPKERFLASGAKDQIEFAKTTDGDRTPWAEWYDSEKIMQLFGNDYKLNWFRNFGKDNIEFNWFQLSKIST